MTRLAGRTLRRAAVLAGTLLTPALAQAAPPSDVVTRWRAGNWTIWRIDRPSVGHAATSYPDIRLHAGDRVMIDAGGCAQVAEGRVPYLGDEGAEGLISIGGLTDGLVPVRSVLRQELVVPEGTADQALQLGFRSQGAKASASCSGQPEAFLYIGLESTIYSYAPMDMIWSAADRNGIPLDPKWGQQANVPGSIPNPVAICFAVPGWFQNPICTTQRPSYDTATWFKAVICEIGSTTPLAGHVNWYPATYEGPIYWSSKAWADSDYNINLVPINQNGLVSSSGSTLHTEFDSRETVDNFTSPWWVSFRNAVGSSDSAAKTMIDGRKGIVSGLAGLDCEHDCYTEIHPVWLMAIRSRQDAYKDVWQIFARNWGNQGYCSRYQHHLLLASNQYKVSLPWRPGAYGVNVNGSQFYGNVSGLGWWWGTTWGQKVNVTFQLPNPDVHGRIHGELVVNWTGGTMASAQAEADLAAAVRPDDDEERGNGGERAVSSLIRELTPEQRRVFERGMGRKPARADSAALMARGRSVEQAEAAAAPAPGVRVVVDEAGSAADLRTIRALRKAYGGRLPGAIGEKLEEHLDRLDKAEPLNE